MSRRSYVFGQRVRQEGGSPVEDERQQDAEQHEGQRDGAVHHELFHTSHLLFQRGNGSFL